MTKPERGIGSFQNLILAIQMIQQYLYLKNIQSIFDIVTIIAIHLVLASIYLSIMQLDIPTNCLYKLSEMN